MYFVSFVTEDDSSSPAAVTIGNPSLRPEHANEETTTFLRAIPESGRHDPGRILLQATLGAAGPVHNSELCAGPVAVEPTPCLRPWRRWWLLMAAPCRLRITMNINGRVMHLYGFEVSYQQHMKFLPGVLKGWA